MKTAFEIKEQEPATSRSHVLLEIAHYGIAVLKFKKEPLSIDAASIYNFSEEQDTSTLAEKCKEVISRINIDNKANLHVFYNFKESLLIPSEFMHEDSFASQLELVYGVSPGAEIAYDEILIDSGIGKQDKIFCVFRIPSGVPAVIHNISTNKPRHSTSVQVRSKGSSVLHCTIFHNTIKVLLFTNDQLLFVQQFSYKTPADAVYHLLNVCDKYDVSPADIILSIDGMIDIQSSLYQEIYKYFLNVQFNVIADNVFLAQGVKEHPLHFITHLTELAQCV